MAALYQGHYRSLVRLATLLVGDIGVAESIVQDSFIAMYRAWRRLREPERALGYLRQAVVHRSRSATGRQLAAGQPSFGTAGTGDTRGLISALLGLPQPQREALVLRLYLDLPERQVAAAMGVTRRVAESQLTMAVAALRGMLTLGA